MRSRRTLVAGSLIFLGLGYVAVGREIWIFAGPGSLATASASFDDRTIRAWYVPVYLAISCFAIAGAFALARISQLATAIRSAGAGKKRTPASIARIVWMSAILFGFLPPYLLGSLTLQWLNSIPRGGQPLGFRLMVPQLTAAESIVLTIVAACFVLTPLGLIATAFDRDGFER